MRLGNPNGRIKDTKLGKMISDIWNDIPTDRIVFEFIQETIIDKGSGIIVNSCRFISSWKEGVAL